MRAYLAAQEWYGRRFIAPQFDAAGEGLKLFKPRYISVHGPRIRIGRHVHIAAEPGREVTLVVWPTDGGPGEIEVGDYTILLPGVRISSASSIRIGANSMLASGSHLSDADWHDIYDRTSAPGGTAPIVLEENVWIGNNAIVLKGVTIGRNSIVGAGAVVTRDVPPNTVVAGNPAQRVRSLDPDATFVTRSSLFQKSQAELDYAEDFLRRLVAEGNTLPGWIRSTWWRSTRH
jgi:acetyltransferase-like isoleucine patch superfamily enzyme